MTYVKILEEELVPAMGCTEPIAVAYAAAKAREVLGKMPEETLLQVSGSIIKNVKSVVVPNTNGLKGLEAAAAAGIVAGKAEKELEVVSEVTEEEKTEIAAWLKKDNIRVEHVELGHVFDIIITEKAGEDTVMLRICDHHTNIIHMEKNGEVLLHVEPKKSSTDHAADRSLLTMEGIWDFATTCDTDDVKNLLDRQIAYNTAISERGLAGNYGSNIGKLLLKTKGSDLENRARAKAAAGSDARMNGCELPVVINSGSGNQGITCSVPVIEYAKELKADQETLYRALLLSNLTAIHEKAGIGTLSAYCGAVSAGIGAGDGWNRISTYGDITISGGIVKAKAGTYSAAIGGGNSCEGGRVFISGGTVQTEPVGTLGDIGRGSGASGSFPVVVTGGCVYVQRSISDAPTTANDSRVWRVNVPCSLAGPVAITGLGDYGTNDLYPINDNLYLYLENGSYDFTAGGVHYAATVADADTTAVIVGETVKLKIPDPLPDHVRAGVYLNAAQEISGTNGVYTVPTNANVSAVFSAETGWLFEKSGTDELRFDFHGLTTNVEISVADIGSVVRDREHFADLTIERPLPVHVSLREVWIDGVSCGTNDVTYLVPTGRSAVARFEADAGWLFVTNNLSTWEFVDEAMTNDVTLGAAELAVTNLPTTVLVRLPSPLPVHVTNAVVTANDVVIQPQEGVYPIPYGSSLRVIFTAEEGYAFENGETYFVYSRVSVREDLVITEEDLPTLKPIVPALPLAAIIRLTGETNYYSSVTSACAALIAQDTLVLLTNTAERIDFDRGFPWTLDGAGWTASLGESMTLNQGSSLVIRDTFFVSATNEIGFARLAAGASLSLTNVAVTGFSLTNAPLVRAENASLTVEDCSFSNNVASALFRVSGDPTDSTAVRFVSASLSSNVVANVIDIPSGIVAVGRDFLSGVVRLQSRGACLAPLAPLPSGDIYFAPDKPEDFVGALIVTNAFEAAFDAARVRLCAAGYAAFGTDGNLIVEAAWSRPFAVVSEGAVTGVFVTAGAAIDSVPDPVDLRLLAYANAVLDFETNVVTATVDIPAGRMVTLKGVLRYSADGTNTTWNTTTNIAVTLTGALDVHGSCTVGKVILAGPVTIYAGGQLCLGAGFDFGDENLYVTLDNPSAMGSTVFLTAEGLTPAELKAKCRVTNPGWTFDPVEGGLRLKAVTEIAARIGLTEYTSFDSALAAVTNDETIACVSLTNTTLGTHTDVISAAARSFSVPADRSFAIGSERRVTTGSDVTWDLTTNVVTTLDLDGVTLELGARTVLDLRNVNVRGTIRLTGEGYLSVTNYAGAPISLAFERPKEQKAIYRLVARGRVEQFALVSSEGELVQTGDEVYWWADWFSWSYRQEGNGIGYLTINDGGNIFENVKVSSTTGTFVYSHTRAQTGEKKELVGYLLYVDYDAKPVPIVHVPSTVTSEYLNENGDWIRFQDGAKLMIDWKVDSDGQISVRFNGSDIRKVKGIASKPQTGEQTHQTYTETFKNTKDKDDGDVGAVIGGIIGGAGAIGGGAALYGLLNGLAAGGVGVGAGVGGVAALGEMANAGIQAANAAENAAKFKKFHDYLSKFFDAVTIAQMLKDIIQMAACPLEYKGVPYFSSRFKDRHQAACSDNNPNYSLHWFYTTDVNAISLPTSGNADITADYGMQAFILALAQAGSLEKGSAFERFLDALNWTMRIDGIMTLLIEGGKPDAVAIVGEVLNLIKQIVNASRARSYFDPPTNSSVEIPSGCGYTILCMDFGTTGGSPKSGRTSPILIVKSGARLRLGNCTFGGYSYNCKKGLVYVESGGVLSLDDVKVNSCTSQDGAPVIVAEPGAVVWVSGSTSVANLISGSDVRIGFGPYRNQSALSAKLSGSVSISGLTKVGDKIGTVMFLDSTTNGYKSISSAEYGTLVEPKIVGSEAVWALKSDSGLTIEFVDPLRVDLIGPVSQRVARVSGTLKSVSPVVNYRVIGATRLLDTFEPESGGTIAFPNGVTAFTNDIPVSTSTHFFKVEAH